MKFNTIKLTPQQITELILKFNRGIRKTDLLSIYGISRSFLNIILRQHGIKNSYNILDRARKYSYDEKFFDIIDSEEKAYWFGFLLADGYISSHKQHWYIQLRLTDLDAIIKFKESIKATSPIKTILSDKRKTCHELQINSKYMVDSLAKHGLVNNKTFRIHIPDTISIKLWPHLIRGYFDGDGCIYIRKNNSAQVQCTFTSSSIQILDQIEIYLKRLHIINKNRNYIRNYGNYRVLSITTRQETHEFLNLIYGNATIYLDRKHKKALDIIGKI